MDAEGQKRFNQGKKMETLMADFDKVKGFLYPYDWIPVLKFITMVSEREE